MEEVLTYSISKIAKLIKKGDVSPVDLTKTILKRIENVDPILNTHNTVNVEQALSEAEKVEAEIKEGIDKGPLHGIPLGVKDNVFTKGLKTTMGSHIYKDFIPDKDAPVIEQLKKAGAIMIGKHNLHQFAYGPTGDRSHLGPARNPYDPSKMAGGSSGGSAAAVSACLAYGALGTDTSGSVRIPASFCGIVGMKPTSGLVNTNEVYPLSWTMDHVGPMTRDVMDNALLLNAIADSDGKKEDYTRLIGKSIKGKEIGIPSNFYFDGLDQEIMSAVENAVTVFNDLGVQASDVHLTDMENIIEAQRVILRSEAFAIHEVNLEKYPDLWDGEVKERLLTAHTTKGFEYARALQRRQVAIDLFNRVLESCDILVTPTMSIMPPKVGARYTSEEMRDEHHIRWTIINLTSPTNLNGFPSLTLPCGFSKEGMPIGVQLIGKKHDEATMYQFAYALEQALKIKTAKFDVSGI